MKSKGDADGGHEATDIQPFFCQAGFLNLGKERPEYIFGAQINFKTKV